MTGPTLTPTQVLALAPDASSAKAGQGLATPTRWSNLGSNTHATWGECQGSGARPYQTSIDFSDLTTRCSCPSRKFPCKHALGLMLLRASDPTSVQHAEPPAWVTEWLHTRAARQNAKAERAANNATPANPEAKARRATAREQNIRAGLDELTLWLHDLMRGGLASANTRPYSDWETMAARLVDAQARGAARLVRELPGVIASGEGWPERLLARLAQLHLLAEGYRRAHTLPPDMQAELRSALGWTPDTAEVLNGESTRDTWAVLGQTTEQDEQLTVRRTWLRGSSGRDALILDFAHASTTLPPTVPPGVRVDAHLCFYPAAHPLRAVIKTQHASEPLRGPHGEPDIPTALHRFATALARNPWLERFPLTLSHARLAPTGNGWQLQDTAGRVLPIQANFTHAWQLHAFAGGHPISIHGEWDGRTLRPLGAGDQTGWLPLTTPAVNA